MKLWILRNINGSLPVEGASSAPGVAFPFPSEGINSALPEETVMTPYKIVAKLFRTHTQYNSLLLDL